MATEDIKRLRWDGEVVGYLRLNEIITYSDNMEDWTYIGSYTAECCHKADEPDDSRFIDVMPQWDSFDHSLKQGDEWFFEGDEVKCGYEDVMFYHGILRHRWNGWYIDRGDVKNEGMIDCNDTLTLIKRGA